MTPERLSEIRARHERAMGKDDCVIRRMARVALFKADIPDLLAEVERLNAELAEARRYKRAFEWLEAKRPEVRPDIVDEDEDGLPTPDMLGLPVDSDFWRIKHHGDDATRRLDVMGVRLLEAVEAGIQEAPRG